MKNLLSTTAAVAMIAGASWAQDASGYVTRAQAGDLMASDLIGARLHAADFEGDPAEHTMEWEDIGEINDLIVTRDGSVQAVLVDIGGFLGMGERQVAIAMSDLSFLAEDGADDADDFRVVVDRSREMLEQAPEFEMDDERTAAADMAALDAAKRPMIERDGWAEAARDDLTAEDLQGVRVYGVEDEDIGEISNLVVTEQGDITEIVMDIGGFLGMGEHRVAMPFEQVSLVRERDGDDLRAYIDASLERLKGMPEYTN